MKDTLTEQKAGTSGAASNARVSNPRVKVTRVGTSGFGTPSVGRKAKGKGAAVGGFQAKGQNTHWVRVAAKTGKAVKKGAKR